MAHLMKCLVFLLATCIGLGYATELKKYEIFTATDKTKWIQVSQLEQIFSSIEESLREMNEKQKRDTSVMTQLSSNVQSINIRLQGIEDQLTRIERAESYSKAQLQQFADGSIKEEIQIDQISHRLEKNQQQLYQRLNDVDSNLENILKIQDIMEKEIRKINVAQNTLTYNVDELSQHTKQQSSKILQNITSAQQELHQKLKESIKSTPPPEEKVRILTAFDLAKNSTNQSKFSQNDDNQMEWIISMFNFENKLNEIKNQAQSMEINLQECTEVANKIYNKLDSKKDDMDLYMKDQFTSLLDQLKQQNSRDLNELEGKFRKNFDSIFNEQVSFKNTCHRLQLYEMQMEDKAVEILEKLFNYIDNRTYEIQHEIENLVTREGKLVENHTAANNSWKSFKKLEEKLKTGQNGSNSTQNDGVTQLPVVASNKANVANNLDGTNVQVVKIQPLYQKKTTMPREWLPNEGSEKVYLADEPQRQHIPVLEQVQHIAAIKQMKTVSKTQPVNVVPELNQIPEQFFGIEGLSRSK